jgi:hypothetical protein
MDDLSLNETMRSEDKKLNMNTTSNLLCAALAALATSQALADTSTFSVPDYRGQPGTTSGGWERLTVAVGQPGNAPDLPSTLSGATLVQTLPGAIATGGGNLYQGAGPASYQVSYNPGDAVGLVTFQMRTLGTELDYSSVRLAYDVGAGLQYVSPAARIEFERAPSQGFPGFNVTSRWDWNLTGTGATSYRVEMTASGPHQSLDSAMLDSAKVGVVPEPSTWALMGAGALLLASRWPSRRR